MHSVAIEENEQIWVVYPIEGTKSRRDNSSGLRDDKNIRLVLSNEMLQIPCRVDRLLCVDSHKPKMAALRITVSHSHKIIGREREKQKTEREKEKTSAHLQDRAGAARRQRPASCARSFLAKFFPGLLFQPDAQLARGFPSFSRVFAILGLVESKGGRGRERPGESEEERRGTKEKEKEKK